MRCIIALLTLLAGIASAQDGAALLPFFAQEEPGNFTIHFTTGTPPTNIVLHADYTGPATPAAAFYDSGDGIWHAYTAKNIPIVGSYVAFKGDWRTSAGAYDSIFRDTFAGAGYEVETSGTLEYAATADHAYDSMFRGCSSLVALDDNPFQPIAGSPVANMFYATFYNTSLTSIPDGCFNTSGLTGSPTAYMFFATFYGNDLQSNNVTIGGGITLTDANISTGNPLSSMFQGNANWTGQLYWGTNVIHTALTPTADINTFNGCMSMPDYGAIDANWK